MKNLQTFEQYIVEGYYGYDNKSRITPRDANFGIQYILRRDLMPTSEDKYIKSIEDLSSEKGIKFDLEIREQLNALSELIYE